MNRMKVRHDLPDPRSFVKSAPLPLPSHQGVKIQARTLDVYNATLPVRDDIRKENYLRRREQMNSMGFQTPANIPYRVIGSPLYLDQKQIILYGLGQFTAPILSNQTRNNEQTIALNNNSTSNVSKPQGTNNSKSKPVHTFSFRSLKDSKELINLNNEVKKTKDLIRRVKLGNSLFDLLKKEEEEKTKKLEREKSNLSTEMQIRPMNESDEELEQEFSEDEITESNRLFENPSPITHTENMTIDIEPLGEKSAKTQRIRIVEDNLRGKRNSINEFDSERPHTYPAKNPYTLPRPQTVPVCSRARKQSNSTTNSSRWPVSVKSGKKKLPEARKPYTPVYSALLSNNEEEFLISKESITRQLCVLLWILDSMSVEQPNAITQLRSCFLIDEISGEKFNESKAKSKLYESKQDTKEQNKETKQEFRQDLKPDFEAKWKQFIRTGENRKDRLYYASLKRGNQKPKKGKLQESQSDDINQPDDDTDSAKDNKRVSNETPTSGTHDQSLVNDDDSSINVNHKIPLRKHNSILSMDNVLSESVQDTTPIVNQNLPITNTSQNLDTNRDSIIISNLDLLTSRDYSLNPENLSSILMNTNTNATTTTTINNNTSGAKNTRISSSRLSSNEKKKPTKSSVAKRRESSRSLSRKKSELAITEFEMELLHLGDEDEMDRIFNKPGIKLERKNSKSLKATSGPIHALWTENVLNYQNSLPSVTKSAKLENIKNRFNNVMDEKAIEIHKQIEQLIKKRIKNCMIKFSSMDTNDRGLHNMLKRMNDTVVAEQQAEDLKNSPGPKFYQWFLDIKNIIETYYNVNNWVLGTLVERLSFYGKLTTKKQNEASFFRILESLRLWEIFSPDVMSAIDFCRTRILEIKDEQFEAWLKTLMKS